MIQRSEESVRTLARRHGVRPTTVKWRKRSSTADAPMGPKTIHSTMLTTEEEAMIVAFRRLTPYEYIARIWTEEPKRFNSIRITTRRD